MGGQQHPRGGCSSDGPHRRPVIPDDGYLGLSWPPQSSPQGGEGSRPRRGRARPQRALRLSWRGSPPEGRGADSDADIPTDADAKADKTDDEQPGCARSGGGGVRSHTRYEAENDEGDDQLSSSPGVVSMAGVSVHLVLLDILISDGTVAPYLVGAGLHSKVAACTV